MNRAVPFVIGIIAVGLFGYSFVGIGNRPAPGESLGDLRLNPAPDFALNDYRDTAITLSQFRGRPVVVNSWASWCPFCREELKDFAAVRREFGDRVVIIAIDRAEPLETAKRYSDDLGVSNDLIMLLDPSDSFYRSIGGFAMPETIFVDASGNIVFHKRGPMKADEIRQRLKDIFEL